MRPLLINQALRALLLILLGSSLPSTSATCRTFCSNLTVDYPLTTSPGCGHPAFKEVLFCINGALMLHSSSNSYRVSAIDYASSILTIQDPASAPPTCSSNTKPWRSESGGSLGFMVDEWHEGFMWVEPENVFLLLGCGAKSKVFQGFPERRMACREGAGCEAVYSRCGVEYGGCCAVGGSEVGRREIVGESVDMKKSREKRGAFAGNGTPQLTAT
ncbi:hypothetical protein AMTR_s00096p00034760 [Amborella trichopoda]|uniref:Wall-associated receptor kinase galacturonan-binding domain-containing protein n=1 Tax=Amborella trichopoda TaxID=13333 RepID=W1P5V7_AMBTC|nr:hypothetical protein AMTR_s00096p00034760 [Amborella trichopoda]